METNSFRAMNSEIVLAAECEPDQAREQFAKVRSFIDESEQRFSRFREDSELCELNRSTGKWIRASSPLLAVIREARDYFHQTHGLFDPSILPELKREGYSRSMDEIRGQEALPVWPLIQCIEAFDAVELDEERRSIRLPLDMQIDLGGIAKGWIAEQAAGILAEAAPTCAVSAGGDMFLKGLPEGQDHWEIDLEDPRDANKNLAALLVREGAVATSSITKRTWKQGGVEKHHVIDPRTGQPAETRWLSITVAGKHAAQAEAFAKAFLIAGEKEAAELSIEQPGLTVLAVDRNGNLMELSEQKERRNADQPNDLKSIRG